MPAPSFVASSSSAPASGWKRVRRSTSGRLPPCAAGPTRRCRWCGFRDRGRSRRATAGRVPANSPSEIKAMDQARSLALASFQGPSISARSDRAGVGRGLRGSFSMAEASARIWHWHPRRRLPGRCRDGGRDWPWRRAGRHIPRWVLIGGEGARGVLQLLALGGDLGQHLVAGRPVETDAGGLGWKLDGAAERRQSDRNAVEHALGTLPACACSLAFSASQKRFGRRHGARLAGRDIEDGGGPSCG